MLAYKTDYAKIKGQRESGFLSRPTHKVRGGTKMDNSNYNSIIWLTQGKYTIVDNEDYEFLNQWKWWYHHKGYAIRLERVDGKNKHISLHRLVYNTPHDKVTDHINGIKLDNRKANLRAVTQQQNACNSIGRIGTSLYKGVSFRKPKNQKHNPKWYAQISMQPVGGKRVVHLGSFATEIEAAKAYNEAAKKYFGEYARLNEIP